MQSDASPIKVGCKLRVIAIQKSNFRHLQMDAAILQFKLTAGNVFFKKNTIKSPFSLQTTDCFQNKSFSLDQKKKMSCFRLPYRP